MLPRLGTPGLLLALLALGACGVPPYSSVRDVTVQGLYTLKFRGGVHEDLDLTQTDRATPGVETQEPIDTLFSYGLEIERRFESQWAASFAVESRQYEAEGAFPNIRGNQLRASFRRYFGDRALTAFVAGDVIYGAGLRFQDDSGETEPWLGWGVGGGINLALNENFSVEGYLMYESIPGAKFEPAGGGVPPYDYGISGPVAYVALGWHF